MSEDTQNEVQSIENVIIFDIPNTETKMQIDLAQIPAALRMELLQKQVEAYVRNSVNQANVRHNKAMEPWEAYEKAQAVDPMQTAVKKPEGEQPTVDLLQVATDARQRLYENEIRRQGKGGGTRKTKDPLTDLVTKAVIRELFDNKKEQDNKYKWTDAVKEVGGDGIKYLDTLIEEKVKAGADREALEKFKESRYIQPAKLMLGQRDTATTKDQSLIG